MQKKWIATTTHDDPFKACGKCSWNTVSGIPCSSSGGNNYACTQCGLIWRQKKRGVLSSCSGKIKMPLDKEGDVIDDFM